LVQAAASRGINLLTPRIGEKLIPGLHVSEDWWRI
jgi:hypothetical protein